MSKVVSVLLEWRYVPESYLEEPISISFEGYSLEIKDGIAVAKIDPPLYNSDGSIWKDLTHEIESRLVAVQLLTHHAYELSKPSRTDVREDGTRHCFLESEDCAVLSPFSGTADIIVRNKSGDIVRDTKRKRLDKQKHLALLVKKHRNLDATLDHVLNSHQKSTKDSDNELVHLYEAREAIGKRFGSKKSATRSLKITNADWDRIGELANALPLKQGRHRGQSVGTLRDATGRELEEGHQLVKCLIEKYLEYLETGQVLSSD
jgi:hypothetical protein